MMAATGPAHPDPATGPAHPDPATGPAHPDPASGPDGEQPDRHARSDLGRRVVARRVRLGLSREEVAARSGAAPSYIAYIEEQLPTPGVEFLVRLAGALETSVQDLAGYSADLPPGSAVAGRHPRLVDIDEAECWELVDDHGVGRVAFTGPDGPLVFPVNYQVVDGELVMLTAADSALGRAAAAGGEIAFEQDRVDEAFSRGWSVLATGPARTPTDEPTAARLRAALHSPPWAGDDRDTLVVLTPARVTGRRVRVTGAPGDPSPRPATGGTGDGREGPR